MHCRYTKYVTMLYTMYGFYAVHGLFCDQYDVQKSMDCAAVVQTTDHCWCLWFSRMVAIPFKGGISNNQVHTVVFE